MQLGQTIVKIRKDNGLTQEDFANKYNVTRQTVSNWENEKSYPDLRIVLMSPIYCEFGDAGEQKCYNTKVGNGRYLDEYVALEKEIAQDFEVEWIDAYHGSGIWAENAEQYIPDGLHLNTDGHKKIADFLADYLQVD